MKKVIVLIAFVFLAAGIARSQGCIAVRNISGFGQYNLTSNAFTASEWQLNINTRYFRAYRDYKENVDLKTPAPNQNIIKSYSMDINITRLLNKGWSIDFMLPVSSNTRSSTFEHGGPNTPRHTTRTFGIGDVRFTAYKWLLAPRVTQKGNMQVGLGVKLPTGVNI